MATILILALDRRREKKDGTYPICLRLNFGGTQSYIHLGRSVQEKYWSAEFGRVTRAAPVKPSPTEFNAFLQQKLSDAISMVAKLENNLTLDTLTHAQLSKMIKAGNTGAKTSQQVTFTQYLDQIVKQYEQVGNLGQASVYRQAKGFLTRYGDMESGEYRFEQINYRLLRLIEEKFQPRQGGNMNGLSFYMRTLRAAFNRAIKEDLVSMDKYPFKKYQIKKSNTHKTAITMKDIEKIIALALPQGTLAWHGRNMFLFSFHCRGMNFADLAPLRYANIEQGRIIYTRKKTGKRISILINAAIRDVLNLYASDQHKPSDYIFPVISTEDEKQAHRQTMIYLGSVNHALKRWACQLTLPHSLSFNTARHSWATIGRNMNLPIAVISQGLGHADVETTAIYLDEFDLSVMDQAADMVSGSVNQTKDPL